MAIIDIARTDGSIVKCDTEMRTLTYYRYHVKFTPLEWKILKSLYSARPHVVTREDLVKLIWEEGFDSRRKASEDGDNSSTRTIDVHIASIRKKIAHIRGARIDSIYGQGYRLLMLQRF